MEKFQNYIRVNGEYMRQEDIPEEQFREIQYDLMVRLAGAFGYVPVETKEEFCRALAEK